MSRQRTKIGEHWRVGVNDYESAADARVYRKPGERIVKVTRYRLAPLVELPAWSRVTGGYATHEANVRRAFIEVDGDEDSEDGCNYEAFVYGDGGVFGTEILASMVFESSDLSEVKEWVAGRLRELGYRVAKAKKGGAS